MFEAISHALIFAQAKEAEPSFFQGSFFLFLLLILAVVAGVFLAKTITKSLQLSECSGRLGVVLVTLLVAGLMIYSKWPPKFGVDLRGGINMIGSLNLKEWEDGEGNIPEASSIISALVGRVNPSGTKEIMIRPLGKDKIEVTMPTVELTEARDIWNRLAQTGKLEFRIIANPADHATVFELARQAEAAGATGNKIYNSEKKLVGFWTNVARKAKKGTIVADKNGPFKYIPGRADLVRNGSTAEILNVDARLTGDSDAQGIQLAKWAKNRGIRNLQVLVVQPPEEQNVEGRHLSTVRSETDERGRNSVGFDLNAEGSLRMGLLTRMNIKKPMGIVLDNKLHSAPIIQSNINRRGTITGDFTTEEVNDLIINLKSGKLDVALNDEPISSDFIESTLGNELKQKGIFAIGASLALVLVFMIFYYRFAGIVATTALMLNLVLILALVMAIEQPFSLTGLAGLVLTVGMSVDANVLIFERIREELDRGAALRMAIRNGFDKATTTIVDANVTTLITALVLYVIGTEQIKGFSVTLILGILMSMYTAIYVSRLVFDIWERKRWLKELKMTRIMEKNTFNFLGKVKITSVISAALMIAGLSAVFLLGARILDQDLRGGSTARMEFVEKQDIEWVRKTLADENIEHKGEKVEFTVNAYGTTAEAGRKYKVDCSLPAYEAKKDEDGNVAERFEELDEILARVFAGKLLTHHVDIPDMKPVKAELPASPSGAVGTPAETGGGTTPDVGMYWRSAPTSLTSLATGGLFYQDPEPTTPPAETPGSTPVVQAPQGDQTPPTDAAPTTDATTDATTQDPSAPAALPGATTSTPPVTAPQKPKLRQMIKVNRTMKVTPALQGKSLRAHLYEAALKQELEMDESDIVVDTEDAKEDEAPLATVSEDWAVTFNVAKESQVDDLLRAWKTDFDKETYFATSSAVGGQIADEAKYQALAAIIASLLGIVAYVWIRFQNLAFGLAAVIALVHDVAIVLGAIAISHWLAGMFGFLGIDKFKISLEIIAALLTVIGYSLNDTIVVFDRIREVRGKRTEISAEMINSSISQTLSRTILTSVTTFIVVFILYVFGGDAIHGFAYALVIGVLVGTYSSIFVASPALLWLMNSVGLNPGEVDPEKLTA